MEAYWGFDDTNLIISVEGGAQGFNIPLELSNNFKKGLFQVAKLTDAWIITGGSNVGVMGIVGDAMRGYTGKVLGIGTWGITDKEPIYKVKYI